MRKGISVLLVFFALLVVFSTGCATAPSADPDSPESQEYMDTLSEQADREARDFQGGQPDDPDTEEDTTEDEDSDPEDDDVDAVTGAAPPADPEPREPEATTPEFSEPDPDGEGIVHAFHSASYFFLAVLFGEPWVIVALLIIFFTVLFYHLFRLGLLAIPHFNSDDQKKNITRNIAKILALIASSGLFGFPAITEGPSAVVSNVISILNTARLIAVWGTAVLMGALVYFTTSRSHSNYPHPSNENMHTRRGKWAYAIITVFFSLFVGYGLLGEAGTSMTFLVLCGIMLIYLIIPTEGGANPFSRPGRNNGGNGGNGGNGSSTERENGRRDGRNPRGDGRRDGRSAAETPEEIEEGLPIEGEGDNRRRRTSAGHEPDVGLTQGDDNNSSDVSSEISEALRDGLSSYNLKSLHRNIRTAATWNEFIERASYDALAYSSKVSVFFERHVIPFLEREDISDEQLKNGLEAFRGREEMDPKWIASLRRDLRRAERKEGRIVKRLLNRYITNLSDNHQQLGERLASLGSSSDSQLNIQETRQKIENQHNLIQHTIEYLRKILEIVTISQEKIKNDIYHENKEFLDSIYAIRIRLAGKKKDFDKMPLDDKREKLLELSRKTLEHSKQLQSHFNVIYEYSRYVHTYFAYSINEIRKLMSESDELQKEVKGILGSIGETKEIRPLFEELAGFYNLNEDPVDNYEGDALSDAALATRVGTDRSKINAERDKKNKEIKKILNKLEKILKSHSDQSQPKKLLKAYVDYHNACNYRRTIFFVTNLLDTLETNLNSGAVPTKGSLRSCANSLKKLTRSKDKIYNTDYMNRIQQQTQGLQQRFKDLKSRAEQANQSQQ